MEKGLKVGEVILISSWFVITKLKIKLKIK